MPSLTYHGCFIQNDGYGRVATNIVLELFNRGWDISLGDINEKKYTKARAHPLISKNYDTLFGHANTEYQITHAPPIVYPSRVSSLAKHAIFTTFETTHPPSNWKSRIERTCNGLIVTSHWVREVFSRALDLQVPIYVVHHGFDLPKVDITKKWNSPEPFRFIMVAANPFDERKNGWSALKAFEVAFPIEENEDVELWIIGHSFPNIYSEDRRILTFMGDLSDYALHKMYLQSHVLVAPSRGEGFGLTIFEGMHFGLIPLITDWSTPGSIIPSSISYKIPVKKMKTIRKGDGNPWSDDFFVGDEDLGEWAEPSFSHIIEAMRTAYETRGEGLVKAEAAASFVSSFTVKKMVDEFEAVLANL